MQTLEEIRAEVARVYRDHLPARLDRLSSAEQEAMFDRIAPVYDAMNRVMTAGLGRRWRRLLTHGGGVATLYAHQSSIVVSPGAVDAETYRKDPQSVAALNQFAAWLKTATERERAASSRT